VRALDPATKHAIASSVSDGQRNRSAAMAAQNLRTEVRFTGMERGATRQGV
jgi:hypothetical protein